MPGGVARGQNLEHLRFFLFLFFSCRKLFVFEQQLLFRVASLCDLGFSALWWGKHHVLITRVDKPSLAQVRPYPTLVLPYPTSPTLPYPTLPYALPCPALPYPTVPPPYALPYPHPHPIPPHPNLPYPTHLASLPFKRKFNLSSRYC